MVFKCLTLMILLFLLNLFSLSQTTRFCSYKKVPCELSHRNDKWPRWCCKIDEICSEHYGQCLTSRDLSTGWVGWAAPTQKQNLDKTLLTESKYQPFTYFVTFLSTSITVIVLIRCIRLCLSYRPEPNENLSNNIPAFSYQPISIIVSNISVEEESPPSYEEVMNDNNLSRFENLE